jgi:hypothetical protein
MPGLERDGLGNAQPGAVTQHQHGTVFENSDIPEHVDDFGLRGLSCAQSDCCPTASRGSGGKTAIAAKVVHNLYTRPDRPVIVAGPGERQSAIFRMRVQSMFRKVGVEMCWDGANDFCAVSPKGSHIVALPHVPDKVRGSQEQRWW